MPRWLVAVVGMVVAVVGVAQGDDLADMVAELDGRVTAIEERLATRPIGTVEAGGAIRFEGEGDAVSESFTLEEATTLFTVALDADGLGSVTILAALEADITGSKLLVSEADPYRGTVAEAIPTAGEYVLAVEAVGAWSVVVEQ